MTKTKLRIYAAWVLLILSVFGGIFCTFYIAKTPYERVLMGISWLAIIITCIDVISTQDVRDKQ